MSKQAKPAVIGIFVVGAVVLSVAAVLIFGSGKFLTEKWKYVLFFEGSVKGLNIGAPVDFKGVRVGTVTDIKVFFDSRDLTFKIPIYIEIERDRITEVYPQADVKTAEADKKAVTIIELLVKQGLKARLEMQSLVTGLLTVSFDFYPEKPAEYFGAEPRYVELPTTQSGLQALTKTISKLPLEELANKLVLSIEGIEKFINSPDLKDTVSSMKQTVDEAKELLQNIDEQIRPLSASAQKTLTAAEKMFLDVDKEINPLALSIHKTVKSAGGVLTQIDAQLPKLLANIEIAIKTADGALKRADKTFSNMEGATGEDSALRYELANTLKELSSAARSIRFMFDYLQQHPEALVQGKGKNEGKSK